MDEQISLFQGLPGGALTHLEAWKNNILLNLNQCGTVNKILLGNFDSFSSSHIFFM